MNAPAPKTSPDAALGNLMAAALDVPAASEQLAVPDSTLAFTGNTADHQAGWFAGIDHERAEARESAGVGAQQLQERADKVVIANATSNPDLFRDAVTDLLAAVRMFRPAPAAGDALGLTLAQKYEDACIVANANARDAARWRAYAAQFPEISAAFLAVHAVDGGDPLPTIKGAAITGGYVVVTPAGWEDDKAMRLRDAILRLFHVNPAHTPRPSDELAAQRKGDA